MKPGRHHHAARVDLVAVDGRSRRGDACYAGALDDDLPGPQRASAAVRDHPAADDKALAHGDQAR